MKKSLLFCGVAALALASCTQNEVLEVSDSRAIGFSSFVGKPTKAVTEITAENLTKFNVFGYHGDATVDYNNVAVTGTTSSGWNPATVAYWVKEKNAAYEFAAYSNQNESLDNVSFANKTLTISNYSVDNKDLIAAQTSVGVPESSSDYPETVGFEFYHMLSQIRFSFKTDAAESYIMKVSNIKINAGKTGATGTFVAGSTNPTITWTGASNGDYTIEDITDIAYGKPETPTSSKYLIILPQNTGALNVTFTVTLTDAEGAAIGKGNFTAPLKIDESGNAWKSGYRYNYTATIKGSDIPVDPENPDTKVQEIKFNVTSVDGWDDETRVPDTTEPSVTD